MRTYYSQLGADFLLWQLFEDNQRPGFFVDVGALDGMRFSNTYSFEREGWTGICVEAHPDYYDLLKRNRPHSMCFGVVAGDYDGEVTFYTNKRGSLSTLDPSLEDAFEKIGGEYFTGFEPRRLQMRTLNSILDEAGAPNHLDILSIDVEGAELRVLKGFDLRRFQSRILVIEAINAAYERQLDDYMLAQGYFKARRFRSDIFYCRTPEDASVIANTFVDCTVIQTPHPLDNPSKPQVVHVHGEGYTVESQGVGKSVHDTVNIVRRIFKNKRP